MDFNLAEAAAAGLEPGVWGVTYAGNDGNNNPRGLSFFEQNRILGQQAVRLGAHFVMVDAEDCLKGTRVTRGAKTMVDGVRAGGWSGPVHLTTLGAPENPDVDDYAFDLASFLDTGGGIFPQAYAYRHTSYFPKVTRRYFERVGVPASKLNLMIGLDGWMTGADYAPLLADAGLGPAFSIFMAELTTDAGLTALEPQTKPVTAPDPVSVLAEMRRVAKPMCDYWRSKGIDPKSQRIGFADGVLGMILSEFYAKRDTGIKRSDLP